MTHVRPIHAKRSSPTMTCLLLLIFCSLSGAAKVTSNTNPFVKITVIDIATNAVVSTIELNVDRSFGMIFKPDSTRAYVINRFEVLSVIDTATNIVTRFVHGGTEHFGMSISPDGTRLYSADTTFSSVSVIDTSTNAVLKRITNFQSPIRTAVTPDGKRVYSANVLHTLTAIDAATNTVIAVIPLGDFPPGQFSGPRFVIAPAPQAPRSRDDCKDGNYRQFDPPAGRFKNQGQCIKAFETR